MAVEVSPLEMWASKAKSRTPESFALVCCGDNPVIVIKSAERRGDIGYVTVDTEDMKAVGEVQKSHVVILEGPKGDEPYRDYNFGRAPNNDIVLPSDKVSKLHGKFRRRIQQGSLVTLICDASKNGTVVNGKVLTGADQELSRHAEILVGGSQLDYYPPLEFYRFLQELAQKK
ncbi:MAG TPA: FHA domain-containing protein [Candidatus Nanoarchaeia archaeon]|nr:FHA domain-containing protein [Candidatus Nanoarchaeia archaeon]